MPTFDPTDLTVLPAIVFYPEAEHVDPSAQASILLPFGTEYRGIVVGLLAQSPDDATAMTCGAFDLLDVTPEEDGRYRWHYDNPEPVSQSIELPFEHGCVFAIQCADVFRAFGCSA